MTTLHSTNTYNVQATLDNWFQTQLAGYTTPPLIPTTAVTLVYPDAGIQPPAFSLQHINVANYDRYQGRNADIGESGTMKAMRMMDISVWVSRINSSGYRNDTWEQDMRIMCAVTEDIFRHIKTVNLFDYTTAASPSATLYKINLHDCVGSPTPPDPNPGIMRQRYTISYDWLIRG